jgi:hypothetical protein
MALGARGKYRAIAVENPDEAPGLLLDRLVERMRMPGFRRNRLSAMCTYRTQRRVSLGAVRTTFYRHDHSLTHNLDEAQPRVGLTDEDNFTIRQMPDCAMDNPIDGK